MIKIFYLIHAQGHCFFHCFYKEGGERETNSEWLPPAGPQTRDQTCNPSLTGQCSYQLSPTGQDGSSNIKNFYRK